MRLRLAAYSVIEQLERRYLMDGTFDVPGVQPAALDQPRVNLYVARTPGNPIVATDPDTGDTTFDIQAFLDTGTSSDLLSQETYSALGINLEQFNGQDVFYADTGVAGDEGFNVSEPLYSGIAPFSPIVDGTDITTYNQTSGPFRYELNPNPVDPNSGQDPIDIVGMPVMQGKVMVMDPKPTDNLDLMNTYLYDPGTPFDSANADTAPGIPPTSFHVKLSYSDFSRFTAIDPPGAQPPDNFSNPMIGPDPVAQLDGAPPDGTPPVTIGENNLSTTGTFLLDTGSAASFISQDMASRVGVSYVPGTYNNPDPNINPELQDANGNLIPNQFVIPIGGADGSSITVAGFYLSSLTLQTQEGVPIRFINAPVLVADVTVTDPNTGDQLTLDGDFGMNYMIASLSLDDTGSLSGARGTPWDWVTFDQQTGILGFAPSTGSSGGGATIVNTQLFYNNSVFDGFNTGVSTADDAAIATDKTALQPGDTATFGNYSSYSKGINGMMIDIEGDPDPTAITANDFGFLVGNSSDLTKWTALTVQPTITAEPGAEGAGFIDRLVLTWPDNTITNEWLQVTILSDTNTNLPGNDTFYFGNAPGETGNSSADAAVNVFDVLATRHNLSTSTADVTNQYDFNRDGAVNTSDLLYVRIGDGPALCSNMLNLINPPPLAAAHVAAKSRPITDPYKLKIDMAAAGIGQIVTTLPTLTSASQTSAQSADAAAVAPLYTMPLPSPLHIADVIPAAEILTRSPLPQTSKKHRELLTLTAVARPAQHPLHKSAKQSIVHHQITHAAPSNKPPFSEVKVELLPSALQPATVQ